MRLSEIISDTILKMLEESETGITEIKRNELASMLGCVPSQINYVLSSRFTPEQGYIVESRRGGGGYIRITRIHVDRSSAIMHLINSIGDELGSAAAQILLKNLLLEKVITPDIEAVMEAALSDKAYSRIDPAMRNSLRATIFKHMLLSYI
jgi:transcriptional regulator CtsR